ncbi:MAG TPA: DUF4331 family protein [Kofleriaceae bacterium]|jgi:hypothetical protein
MKKLLFAIPLLVACGDNRIPPDAFRHIDAPKHDGGADTGGFPAAPTMGAQIDRIGRPAIATALVGPLDPDATKQTKRTAYNQANDPTMWATTTLTTGDTILQEFEKSLAIYDGLDRYIGAINVAGCGNGAPFYTQPPGPTSYQQLAGVLSDDQLYVDTALTDCSAYLSLEFELASQITHTYCGGRTPTHDVMDTSLSLVLAVVNGFDTSYQPIVGDGVSAHTDVSTTAFPFLGAPH